MLTLLTRTLLFLLFLLFSFLDLNYSPSTTEPTTWESATSGKSGPKLGSTDRFHCIVKTYMHGSMVWSSTCCWIPLLQSRLNCMSLQPSLRSSGRTVSRQGKTRREKKGRRNYPGILSTNGQHTHQLMVVFPVTPHQRQWLSMHTKSLSCWPKGRRT